MVTQAERPVQPQLLGGFFLPVPGVTDPRDTAGILERLDPESPAGMAFREGGMLEILPAGGQPILLPVRKARLRDCPVEAAVLGGTDQGVVIQLPQDLVVLTAALEALAAGVPYDWERFLADYHQALTFMVGSMMRRFTAGRMDGMQAQVVTDPRLALEEGIPDVGLHPHTARRLLKLLKKGDPGQFGTLETLEGAHLLLMRYPVGGPKGAQWARLRLLADRIPGPIYVAPGSWKEEHGGDEDGDPGFLGHSGVLVRKAVPKLAALPAFTLRDARPVLTELVNSWRPLTPEAAVGTVMKMLTRDLTGPLTWTMHVLARTVAVEYAREARTIGERKEKVARSTRALFKVNFPLLERVMDGKKLEENLESVYGLSLLLQGAVAGEPLALAPFEPFLSQFPEEKALLAGALRICGNSLENARTTAFGKLVAAGRQIGRVGADVVAALLDRGITASEILTRLERDALGEEFLFLARGRRVDDPFPTGDLALEPAEAEPAAGVGLPVRFDPFLARLDDLLPSLTLHGQPLFQSLPDGIRRRPDGTLLFLARFDPVWRKERPTFRVTLELPRVKQVTAEGHMLLWLGAGKVRIFRPRFRLAAGEARLQGLAGWLGEVLAGAIGRLGGRKLTSEAIERSLNRAVREALQTLPIRTPAEELALREEFEVVVAEEGDLKSRWEERRQLLTQLAALGFDVAMTSKNHPGEVATRGGSPAAPLSRLLLAVNPFGRFLDPKRRGELREIRQSLDLWGPSPLKVRGKGCPLPEALAGKIRELTVMVADIEGRNVFTGSDGKPFCFDTLLATESAVAKLAIARWAHRCTDVREKDQVVEELLADGIAMDRIVVTEEPEPLAEGLMVSRWTVAVEGPLRDAGKIKAAVGPIKGVMNVIPERLYAKDPDGSLREIDLVVPRDTIERKKGLDALFRLLAGKADLTEIDPEASPRVLRRQIRAALTERGFNPDGLQEVVAIEPDGTERFVGEAVVGPLPFFRPVQTGFSQFKTRSGENGIRVEDHTLVMLASFGFNFTPEFREAFAALVTTWQGVKGVIEGREEVEA
jgi:hypothetical protein